MPLPISFRPHGKSNTRPLLLRRVAGTSMAPKLNPGQLLFASRWFRRLHPGQVIIILHNGREKVKRVERIQEDKVFVIGDNLGASTDSRHFGWIDKDEVVARVFWPKLAK